MNIQIPDTSKGQQAIVKVKGLWYANYYRDGKPYRRTLKTPNKKDAFKFRDQFFADLVADGATVYDGKAVADKLKNKPGLYIYERKPFIFKVNGQVIAECNSYAEAEKAREEYFATV